MTDVPDDDASGTPFRGSADPLGPRAHRHRIARPASTPTVRLPFAIGAAALAGVSAWAGQVQPLVVFGAIAATGAGEAARSRFGRRPITTVDVHAGGLRIDDQAIAWDDVHTVTLDVTADQRRRAGSLVLDTSALQLRVVGEAAALAPVAEALGAAVVARQRRDAEDRLERGGAIAYGRHQLTADGLVAGSETVRWRDLGPTRRAGGALHLDASIGAFAAPLATIPNPWVIEALVAARGRAGSR